MPRLGEARRSRPGAERLGGTLDRLGAERERRRMGNRRDPRRGERPIGRVEHVAHRKRVGDREDVLLGPFEQRSERARDALRDCDAGLAAAGAERVGVVRPGPGPVVVERAALERAEADLVELRQDEPLDVAPGERQVEGLLRAPEPRRDAEVDRLAGERLAQRECLFDPELGKALTRRDRADPIVGVRAGVRMPREQQTPQKSTLRYASVCRMPTVS